MTEKYRHNPAMPTEPHSVDLRKGRFSEPGRAYLVTTVSLGRVPLFSDFALARTAIGELAACGREGLCETLAYVLMPDHLHWLLVLEDGDLSSLARRFKSRSAIAINRLRNTPGEQVWQRGFHDHALRLEEDVKKVARYVIANPLRASLANSLGEYPHWDALWL